jgi:glutamate dehydrogenase (NAD(P)+)
VCCDEALKYLGMTIEGCRVIVQGFGNVGSNAANLLYRKGYTIIGITEFDGALYNEHGIDVPALLEHRKKAGTINGFAKAEAYDKDELILRPCEILIPAATENVITSQNAGRIRAKILCEGANGPTTSVADEILEDKKVFVIPDILANAGGVTASYFEWVQDRMGYFWTETEVNQRLDAIMTESFKDVISYAESHKVNNRIAAYMLAIDRVAYTTKQRGMYA